MQRIGLRYQARATRTLREALEPLGFAVLEEPWFRYTSDRTRHCRPDVLLVREHPIICEIKLNYTPHRTRKLQDIYFPVVSEAFGEEAVMVLVTRCIRRWRGETVVDLRKIPSMRQGTLNVVLLP